jgi:hypothetical protein
MLDARADGLLVRSRIDFFRNGSHRMQTNKDQLHPSISVKKQNARHLDFNNLYGSLLSYLMKLIYYESKRL